MSPKERRAVQKVLRKRPDLLKAFGVGDDWKLIHFPQYVTADGSDDELYFLVAMADEVATVHTDEPPKAR